MTHEPKPPGDPSGDPTVAMSKGGAAPHSLGATGTGGLPATPTSVPLQDLSDDKLIATAPRSTWQEKNVPALGGIPLLARLGQGGMGAVYYGVHPRLGVEVAVKVLPFHLAAQQPALIQRFYREAQVAARVLSPHLVGVKDVNEENGLYYLVMEFVRGTSAGAYLRQRAERRLPPPGEAEALDACIAASTGLAVAHAQGVIHRDVKPDNILVPFAHAPSPAEPEPPLAWGAAKLADLGLARAEAQELSLTGTMQMLGTPGYMAPEQAMDAKTASKAADVFGIGATLYALLSGHAPFSGSSAMKVLMDTANTPHRPLREIRPDISTATAALVDRCLAKAPTQRFTDAPALLEELRRCRALLHAGPAATPSAIAPTLPGAPAPKSSTLPAPVASPVRASTPAAPKAVSSAPAIAFAPARQAGSSRTLFLLLGGGIAALLFIAAGLGVLLALARSRAPSPPAKTPAWPSTPEEVASSSGDVAPPDQPAEMVKGPEDHRAEAAAHLSAGRWQEAEETFLKVLQTIPGDAQATEGAERARRRGMFWHELAPADCFAALSVTNARHVGGAVLRELLLLSGEIAPFGDEYRQAREEILAEMNFEISDLQSWEQTGLDLDAPFDLVVLKVGERAEPSGVVLVGVVRDKDQALRFLERAAKDQWRRLRSEPETWQAASDAFFAFRDGRAYLAPKPEMLEAYFASRARGRLADAPGFSVAARLAGAEGGAGEVLGWLSAPNVAQATPEAAGVINEFYGLVARIEDRKFSAAASWTPRALLRDKLKSGEGAGPWVQARPRPTAALCYSLDDPIGALKAVLGLANPGTDTRKELDALAANVLADASALEMQLRQGGGGWLFYAEGERPELAGFFKLRHQGAMELKMRATYARHRDQFEARGSGLATVYSQKSFFPSFFTVQGSYLLYAPGLFGSEEALRRIGKPQLGRPWTVAPDPEDLGWLKAAPDAFMEFLSKKEGAPDSIASLRRLYPTNTEIQATLRNYKEGLVLRIEPVEPATLVGAIIAAAYAERKKPPPASGGFEGK